MNRELAQWADALAFDKAHGIDGPDVIGVKLAASRKSGTQHDVQWWLAVTAKLVRLYENRAAQAH